MLNLFIIATSIYQCCDQGRSQKFSFKERLRNFYSKIHNFFQILRISNYYSGQRDNFKGKFKNFRSLKEKLGGSSHQKPLPGFTPGCDHYLWFKHYLIIKFSCLNHYWKCLLKSFNIL